MNRLDDQQGKSIRKIRNVRSELKALTRNKTPLSKQESPPPHSPKSVLTTFINDPCALNHASKELRSDRTFLLQLCETRPWAIRYASHELKDDREFMQSLIKTNGRLIEYASERLKLDRELAVIALRDRPSSLAYLPLSLREDETIAIQALSSDNVRKSHPTKLQKGEKRGTIFHHIGGRLKEDRDFILKAVSVNPYILRNISIEFKQDREIIERVIKTNAQLYYSIPEDFKNDWDLCLLAAQGYACNIMVIPNNIVSDKYFIMKAIKKNPLVFFYIPAWMREDHQIVWRALEKSTQYPVWHYIPQGAIQRGGAALILHAVKHCAGNAQHLSTQLEKNHDLALQCMRLNGQVYDHLPQSLRTDRGFIFKLIQQCALGSNLTLLSDSLQGDREIILELIKQDASHFKFASPHMKKDKSFLIQAIKVNRSCLSHIGEDYAHSIDFLHEVIQSI